MSEIVDPLAAPIARGRLLTIEQVADHFQVTPRVVRRWLKKFPHVPVMRPSERIVRFDAIAINALEEELRCPSKSSGVRIARTRLPSSERSRASAYEDALNRMTDASQKKRRPPSKQKSSAQLGTANVVAFGRSPKP